MDTQDSPNQCRYQLTKGLIGLDNEKDAMTPCCLNRKDVQCATWRVHSTRPARPVETQDGFLLFGGPACADQISNCPLDRVLTYKNLIYLLNL